MRYLASSTSLAILLLFFTVAPAHAEREPDPDQHLGASITGFAGFLRVNVGSYVISYEQRVAGRHALRLAGDFIHLHQDAEHVQSHQWTFGGSLGYRYHVRPGGGLFLGVETGYRRGFGHYGNPEDADHTMLENSQLRVVPEIGARFLHPSLPLSFTTRLGVGYGPYHVTADRDDATGIAAARSSRDNLAATPLLVDVELTIAYSF